MNEYAVWAGPVIALMALGYTIYVNRSKDHQAQFTALRGCIAQLETQIAGMSLATGQRFDKVEDRVVIMEAAMKHMPDKDVTHRLEMAIAELRGDVRALGEQVKPIGAMANRVQEAILERVTT